jgi:hypothetical protein
MSSVAHNMPPSVAEALGPAAADLQQWVVALMADTVVPRPELEEVARRIGGLKQDVDARFDQMDARLGRMDARFGQIDARFDAQAALFDQRSDALAARLDQRLDAFSSRMDARFDRMEERLATQMRWSIGLRAVFATMVTALLAGAAYGP